MQVCTIGAGTMGQGIAHTMALAGHDVSLRDINSEVVESGLQAIRDQLDGGVEREKLTVSEADEAYERITGYVDIEAAVADASLVVEAAPEDIGLKQDIFETVESYVSVDSILATNTSSLSVTEIMSCLDHPERGIGLHFFNPAYIMPLTEIVVAEQTADLTIEFANEFVEGIGKTGIEVHDSPGFASSRLGVALGVEAMRMVETGVASPADIDAAMELGYNYPMGPIELGDVVGLDVRLRILEYLHDELGERFRPPQILKRKVRAGKLGKKSGEGFYRWEDGNAIKTATEDEL